MTGDALPSRRQAAAGEDAPLHDTLPGPRGVHCRACGTTLWPPQEYGCERCGADGTQLQLVELPGSGVLTSYAAVYSHPQLPTPYTVVEVVLDGGQLVRGLWSAGPEPVVGTRVAAVGQGTARQATAGRTVFAGAAS